MSRKEAAAEIEAGGRRKEIADDSNIEGLGCKAETFFVCFYIDFVIEFDESESEISAEFKTY